MVGTLLDGEGFVAGLRSAGYAVAGRHTLISGTGGVGAAIAFALAAHGCERLHLLNRTESKAQALADRLRAAFPRADIRTGFPAGNIDLAINATSLGMRDDDLLPFMEDVIDHAALIADCVVAPEMTRLLQVATNAGRRIHIGIAMLQSQMELMLDFMGA